MRESGYYPAGAEFDPRAPYNQVDPPEMSFDVNCSFTLDKVISITTDNYYPDGDGYDMTPDTSDIDWEDEYQTDYHSIPQLLSMLRDYIMADMKKMEDKGKTKTYRYRQLKSIAAECEGWEVTNSEFDKQ